MALWTELHFVTGKGGTGKTTVAAALAMSLAERGCSVLLCEVENRQGIAQLLDLPPLPYQEKKVAAGRGGGRVNALAIDPEAALLEYLQMYYKLGRAGRALDKFGIIDFATTIAPGVRDVLLTGKIYEAAKRKIPGSDAFLYDAIVVDAPPTGRITRFLGVNDGVAGLAKVGPIKNQSESIMTMMRSASTQVHVVTLLEEMPVQETIDGIAELQDAGLRVGSVIVNLVRPPLIDEATGRALTDGDLTATQVGESLASVGLPAAAAGPLIESGRAYLERLELQDEQRARLVETGQHLIDLPFLPDGIDVGALEELAARIDAAGAAGATA